MPNSAERETLESEQPSWLSKFAPGLAEAWIAATIVAFLLIRILGSNTFKHFARSVGL
jgi:hypothetical protein